MILLNELDLEKSFEKLKSALIESDKMAKVRSSSTLMRAYLNLSEQVKRHITDCTERDQIDDLKDIKFS